MKAKNDDPVMFRFFNEIGIIDQLTCAKLESVLPGNMKISHFVLLNHLVRLGGKWSPARLAAALQVTKAAITNTMNRLEEQGMLRVQADPSDGRGKLVSLTPAGKRMRDQGIANIEPFLDALQREFGDQVFADALPFLQTLRRHLDDHR